MTDDSADTVFYSLLQEAIVSRSGMDGCPLFHVVHPAFLPTTASPTLHGALKDGFGEAVMERPSVSLSQLVLHSVAIS